ncbi:MAG: hypothetical protein GX371_09750 [Bacteroidales bacterium]|nr:hypothetical protein [Bacteroidales bacterium]
MSTKEFIKNQIARAGNPPTHEQFTELSESERSIIILEVKPEDYMLTEIARIVESNNAHVMALCVMPLSSREVFLVSLKFDVEDLTLILRGFERFDYKVIYYFSREGEVTDTQKERLAELLYYLEM